jgi:AraC family transcriptional regulator, positive regulator of tynA and feaB
VNTATTRTFQTTSASIVTRRPRETSWADLISTHIGATHITEAVGCGDGFFGQLTNWRFGEPTFVLSNVRGVSVRGIQAADERRSNSANVWLCICLSGSFELDLDRRSTVVTPDSMAIMSCGRPHAVTFSPNCDVLWVRAPRCHVGSLNRSSGFVVLDAAHGTGRLALQSLQGLHEQAERLNDEDSHQIVRSTLGLVSAAVRHAERYGADGRQRSHSQLDELKQFVEGNLHDESLSLASAARSLGRNPRDLNRTFEIEGSSFMRWTWNQRLERAHRMLANDQQRGSITDVALGCGFKNLSHFSRAFRERFGYPPSRLRPRGTPARRH